MEEKKPKNKNKKNISPEKPIKMIKPDEVSEPKIPIIEDSNS